MARTKNAKVPEIGSEAPEFNLPSAQGGSLRLGMRTATGPVIVAFFRGAWSEDDVSFFKKLAEKEDEINLAIGDVVGIGMVESKAAREFVKASGMKSYILYDYAKTATPAWGLLEKDKENGEYARPATFLIGSDNKVVEAWMDSRPNPDDLLAKVSEITGLPKPPEEEGGDEEKPKKAKAAKKADAESPDAESSEASEKPKREKLSPEEREKRRAERKVARESGGDAKPAAESGEETEAEAKSGDEAGNEAEAEGASSEVAEDKSEVKSGGEAGNEAEGEGSGGQAEGSSAGDSESEDGSDVSVSDGSDEEGRESGSGEKEGKVGG